MYDNMWTNILSYFLALGRFLIYWYKTRYLTDNLNDFVITVISIVVLIYKFKVLYSTIIQQQV